jgi:CheY-like chemotaxis protein
MLIRILDGRSSSVVEAVNGQDAVERIRKALDEECSFDLVLMDYQMPVMDGPSAAQAMREMGYKGPIIGVTGNVMSKDVNTFLSKGADTVLFKPLQFTALFEAVSRKYLHRS